MANKVVYIMFYLLPLYGE